MKQVVFAGEQCCRIVDYFGDMIAVKLTAGGIFKVILLQLCADHRTI